jgi:hypothetical protein
MRMVQEMYHIPLLLLPAQADARAVAVVPVRAATINRGLSDYYHTKMADFIGHF